MSRRPARFTQADIHRAIKAVKQSGERLSVQIDLDGTIRITYPEDGAGESDRFGRPPLRVF